MSWQHSHISLSPRFRPTAVQSANYTDRIIISRNRQPGTSIPHTLSKAWSFLFRDVPFSKRNRWVSRQGGEGASKGRTTDGKDTRGKEEDHGTLHLGISIALRRPGVFAAARIDPQGLSRRLRLPVCRRASECSSLDMEATSAATSGGTHTEDKEDAGSRMTSRRPLQEINASERARIGIIWAHYSVAGALHLGRRLRDWR
ncbi:hypothetical protein C8F01DRAFT_367550 [Mycena amicta]|nr:hypothetical protein C8F01DRAFT_367550 [Mycena amicta]